VGVLQKSKPKSVLGKYVPTAFLREGTLLIVLKSYFDKSGQESDGLLTLGGVAANDEVWANIEMDWMYYLQRHNPPASYMHMVEAIHLRGEFSPDKGWDDDKVFGLTNSLLSYLTMLPDKTKYCQFSCSVKMNDYRKLQAESYQMDSPADLLAASCTERIMQWYFFEYKGLDLEAHYYFDQNEPFEPIIKAKWESETARYKSTGFGYTIWSHISHMGPAVMRKTPGLQVADMLAWATNRHEVKIPQRYDNFVIGLRSLVPSQWAIIDEAQLRKRFRPLVFHPYDPKQI
jgi:hypothetical protein